MFCLRVVWWSNDKYIYLTCCVMRQWRVQLSYVLCDEAMTYIFILHVVWWGNDVYIYLTCCVMRQWCVHLSYVLCDEAMTCIFILRVVWWGNDVYIYLTCCVMRQSSSETVDDSCPGSLCHISYPILYCDLKTGNLQTEITKTQSQLQCAKLASGFRLIWLFFELVK